MKWIESQVTSTKALSPPTDKTTAVLLIYTREFKYRQLSSLKTILEEFSELEVVHWVNMGIKQKAHRDNLAILRYNLHEHPSEVTGGERLGYNDDERG